MDLRETSEQLDFRSRVREFLSANLPGDWRRLDGAQREAAAKVFLKALAKQGWIAPAWPREYGGAGMTYYEQFIFNEEMAKARGPRPPGVGVNAVGPAIMFHGSEEQKHAYLPRIIDMSMTWCQGFSEPGAGSDLANVSTRAERRGDTYVVNGQKTWTSHAHLADRMYLICRTDPEAPKHRGISVFLLDMKTPGITVQPIMMVNGLGPNQVFFDNVEIPATDLMGELNHGWYYTTTVLNTERSQVGNVASLQQTVDDLIAFVRGRSGPIGPVLRFELADRAAEVRVGRMLAFRVVTMQQAGQMPTHEASCLTLFLSEAAQRIARTGMRIAGLYGQASLPKYGRFGWSAQRRYLSTVLSTIVGGTSEIQRNLIATRGLGLPRGD